MPETTGSSQFDLSKQNLHMTAGAPAKTTAADSIGLQESYQSVGFTTHQGKSRRLHEFRVALLPISYLDQYNRQSSQVKLPPTARRGRVLPVGDSEFTKRHKRIRGLPYTRCRRGLFVVRSFY